MKRKKAFILFQELLWTFQNLDFSMDYGRKNQKNFLPLKLAW
jgi:hypothetical protein